MTPTNLGDAEVVVVSTAIKRDNPEAAPQRAKRRCPSCAAPKCWPS